MQPELPTSPDPRRRSFAATAATTYGTNLAVAVLSLVNVLVVARALGPAGRGDVAFLITVAIITGNLAALGVHEANANLAGSEPRLRRSLATNSLLLAAAFGASGAAAVAGLVAAFPGVGGEVDRTLLVVALVSVPAVVLKAYLSLLVQAEYAFTVTNLAWLAGPLTTAAANGVLAAAGLLSVGTAIAAWAGGQLLGTALLLGYVARHAGFGRPDALLARRMLRFGLKTHVGRVLAFGNYRMDQWFVGAMAGSRELGLYSVAVAWAEVLFYLPGVLVLVQRPDLVRAARADAARIAARVFRVALQLAALLALGLILAAPFLCTAVFGDEFAGAADDLRLLALAAFGIAALELLGSALIAQRRPLRTATAVACAFAVTVALDVALIPRYGGAGAAAATAIAWTVGGVAVALIFARTLGTSALDLVPRGSELPWLWRRLRARRGQPANPGIAAADPNR